MKTKNNKKKTFVKQKQNKQNTQTNNKNTTKNKTK